MDIGRLMVDNPACVACGSEAPQLDHVKPVHAGGDARRSNLVPLCEACNKIKGCFWPGHGYHPLTGYDDAVQAADILLAELEHLEDTRSVDLSVARRAVQREGDRWERWYRWYDRLTAALVVELGERAYSEWLASDKGMAWQPPAIHP